jgi:hypothetical protein
MSTSFRPLEIAWRVHVLPKWGARRVNEIQHSDVRSWIAAFSKNRSATTVIRAYGVLAGILDVAVRDRRIPSDPARGVKLPRKPKAKHKYLTGSQVELLASQPRQNRTLVLFLAYTGLRWGEATGLLVGALDFERRRALVEENAGKVGQMIYVGSTKGDEKRSDIYADLFEDDLGDLSERLNQMRASTYVGFSWAMAPPKPEKPGNHNDFGASSWRNRWRAGARHRNRVSHDIGMGCRTTDEYPQPPPTPLPAWPRHSRSHYTADSTATTASAPTASTPPASSPSASTADFTTSVSAEPTPEPTSNYSSTTSTLRSSTPPPARYCANSPSTSRRTTSPREKPVTPPRKKIARTHKT